MHDSVSVKPYLFIIELYSYQDRSLNITLKNNSEQAYKIKNYNIEVSSIYKSINFRDFSLYDRITEKYTDIPKKGEYVNFLIPPEDSIKITSVTRPWPTKISEIANDTLLLNITINEKPFNFKLVSSLNSKQKKRYLKKQQKNKQ